MKNVIVANFRPTKCENSAKQHKRDKLETELKAQIENSFELGWGRDDLIVVTNFSFVFRNVGAVRFDLNENCLTGSKLFALRELFRHEMIREDVWIHDLDAWQVVPFEFPDIKDIGLAEYSRPKFNGGSVFCKPSARDIVFDLCSFLEENELGREEPTLQEFLRGKYKDRTTVVDHTYNVGCSGFIERWERSEKPIKVAHFHPRNSSAWDTHVRGRNGPEYITVDDRLKDLFVRWFGDRIKRFKYEDGKDPLALRDRKRTKVK